MIKHHISKLSILLLITSTLSIAHASSYYSYSQSERQYSGMTISDYSGSDFVLGGIGAEWDDAMRYQFDMAYAIPVNPRVMAMAGGYAFWEDRTYNVSGGKFDYDAFGVGFEGGFMMFPLASHADNKINLGIYPYGRIGFAIQDAKLVNVQDGPDTYDATIGGYKWEMAVGIDVRLQIAQKIYFSLGTGVGIWQSSSEDVIRVDDGNVTYVENVDFDGDDVFYRASIGVFF